MTTIWSYQLNTPHYIEQFKSLNINCVPISKFWYKSKLMYRLEFSISNWKDEDWEGLLKHLKKNNIFFKKRVEHTGALFTNDETALDFILSDDVLRKKLVRFEYTDLAYIAALSRLNEADIANDVKFVKHVPDMDHVLIIGNFRWEEKELFQTVTKYILSNKQSFSYEEYTKDRIKSGNAYWQNFTIYTNNLDEVMMLHIMAPGKVIKVIKLINKEEKHELIASTSTY